jgi:hypothetical protein
MWEGHGRKDTDELVGNFQVLKLGSGWSDLSQYDRIVSLHQEDRQDLS